MLDAWIIEQIIRREEFERRDEQPVLELPLEYPEETGKVEHKDEDQDHGLVVIDFIVDHRV